MHAYFTQKNGLCRQSVGTWMSTELIWHAGCCCKWNSVHFMFYLWFYVWDVYCKYFALARSSYDFVIRFLSEFLENVYCLGKLNTLKHCTVKRYEKCLPWFSLVFLKNINSHKICKNTYYIAMDISSHTFFR